MNTKRRLFGVTILAIAACLGLYFLLMCHSRAASDPREIVFTAQPAMEKPTKGCPIVVKLCWMNRGQATKRVDLGGQCKGGIEISTADGGIYHNQAVPADELNLRQKPRIQPGQSLEIVVVLDEWVTLAAGRQSLLFTIPGRGEPLRAWLDIDVIENSPEAHKAALGQLIRGANSARFSLRSGYIEALARVWQESDAGKKSVIEICKSLGFEKVPAEVEKYLREQEIMKRAID